MPGIKCFIIRLFYVYEPRGCDWASGVYDTFFLELALIFNAFEGEKAGKNSKPTHRKADGVLFLNSLVMGGTRRWFFF